MRLAPRLSRVTLAGALIGLAAALAHGQTITLPERGVAPEFRITAVTGEKLDLAELRKKGPVVLDFWATWCKPCLMALPELEAIRAKYEARGVTVVAISIDGPRNFAKVRPFAARHGLRFPVAIDRDQDLQSRYRVQAVPTTFLIGADGRIAWTHQGYLPGDTAALEKAIEAHLAAKDEAARDERAKDGAVRP